MVEHTPSAAPRSKKEKLSINQPVSSSKSKKIPHMWSAEEEIFMLSEVLNHIKMGFEVPTSKVDDFWSSFSEILQKKVGLEFTREQVNDKFKRLRQRYLSAMQRINASQQSGSQFKHRNSGDQTLFDLSGQIWGKQQASDLSQQEVASGPQNDPSKSNQIPLKATKSKNGGSPNSGSHIAPNDSTKPDSTRITDDNLGENRTVIVGSNEPDTLHIVKGDYEEILANAPLDHVEKLVQERIETAINDLQEWSKRNMEDWMSRTYSLLEESMRKFEEQMRSMSCAGYGNGGLVIPTRFGDTMSYEFMNRDGGIQQQWYDLHLQELRVQAQRLELMRRECELKQEQVKTQFLEQKRNQLS
ncbi:hypothetical protein KP509_10G053300 [Ceratopteris richardii]|nr:hypothetical protein KP509_10G053300 [Ceratopteris richardii]